METIPEIAKRIKNIRLELKYERQEDFATALGLSKQNIQMYESGTEPKSKFYVNLYKAHNINPLYVMGVSDNKYCLSEKETKGKEIFSENEIDKKIEDKVNKILSETFGVKKNSVITIGKYGINNLAYRLN